MHGNGVSTLNSAKTWLTRLWPDAHIFYYLEAWLSNPSEPYTTLYLTQIQSLQRHITTAAFRLAGGLDLTPGASGRPVEQHPVQPAFVQKIVRSFLDALYAFLDGLVHLASEESPIVTGKKPVNADAGTASSTNRLEVLNLADSVCECSLRTTARLLMTITVEYPVASCHLELQLPFYDPHS
jgi:hypothetical protein